MPSRDTWSSRAAGVWGCRGDAFFVPNDTHMGAKEDRVAIITGPNMEMCIRDSCGTVFTPRHPKTKPSVEETREYEAALDVEGLCRRAMANRELIRVKPTF